MKLNSSFRDPSGYMYTKNATLYRAIMPVYEIPYKHLMSSGLYKELTDTGMLVRHEEISTIDGHFKDIKPEKVPFISYPYEWCFSQLKDAALLTLEIQLIALNYGMSLKDASAYNVQFIGSRPIFIDTLSFEIYTEGEAWIAYDQFCRHFLVPLALMSQRDARLRALQLSYIDGIPLDLAAALLPISARFNIGLMMHLFLHAKVQQRFDRTPSAERAKKITITKEQQINLIQSLKSTIQKLKMQKKHSQWGEYYSFTNYSDKSFESKQSLVKGYVERVQPQTIWDLGANNGLFSALGLDIGADVVAFDIDHNAVEYNYSKKSKMLPLILDLTNPTPAIGWANKERDDLPSRNNTDLVMALALVHHLAISNNLPLEMIAEYFAKLADNLIIEWVPKDDSQAQIILGDREFDGYNVGNFEQSFAKYYDIVEKDAIVDSDRVLYLMKKKV